ncbi:HalOD1 output domain-containing protein [Haloprofundus salinisoli]|uniref:HalOD1 output domain-containing protein n=1 Tax=Haloprofundus salinisoli TaxID=2876193 RepID=UPI001CCD798F|nr:HalOD1 output domain-containing protein [Haloprofundus salinisoli]
MDRPGNSKRDSTKEPNRASSTERSTDSDFSESTASVDEFVTARRTEVASATYDPDDPDTLTFAVAKALARAKNTEPLQLQPPIGNVIDLGFAEAVLSSNAAPEATPMRYVGFTYDEYEVVVFSTGEVNVYELPQQR